MCRRQEQCLSSSPRDTRWIALGLFVISLACHIELSAADVSFVRDVMPVLTQSGCNMGACHGNQNGKGGFRLSLRGQNPQFDYEWLTRESDGRRIDLLDPSQSLVLQKPTGKLAHQGGNRFTIDSASYAILRNWISQGAPGPRQGESPVVRLEVSPREQILIGADASQVQLNAIATFADGTRRDVTSLATYDVGDLSVTVSRDGIVSRQSYGESTVIVRYLDQQVPVRVAFVPERVGFIWSNPPANNYVDELIYSKLRSQQINPSELSPDHVFLRRCYLDAIGVLPTADEARAFVADSGPDKRLRLIDSLLARREFAELWALKWSDVLRNEEKVLDSKGVDVFHGWIRDSMADGKPIDQFVGELVRATGSTYDNPPANYYRANRDATTRAETTARLFLGVRLQCARCHNHPFDRWTQDDYYTWSAIFARIDYEIVKNDRRDRLDKHEFVGEQIVRIADRGSVEHPETGQSVLPKLLGGYELLPSSHQDRLTPLAVWLTSTENQLFARSQVNFIWYHLMGRGLVEPIDDVRVTNPASNEPLLSALANDFVAHRFDLRHVVRTIMTSRSYQLAAVPNDTNRDDVTNFSRAIVQRLPAEKLLDAQCQVLDAPSEFSGYPRGTRAGQIAGVRRQRQRERSQPGGDRFLKVFGKPERLLACECERSNETALSQAFALIGGDEFQRRIAQSHNRLDRLTNSSMSDEQLIDELYWTALSRQPTAEEMAGALQLIQSDHLDQVDAGSWAMIFFVPIRIPPPTRRLLAVQDLAWALMNAKEFVFRN